MYRGEGESLYFVGYNVASSMYEVYLLKPEGIKPHIRGYRKIFESEEKITAVTGNGDITYVAIGRLIVKVSQKDGSISRLYLHPTEDITEFAYSQEAGLFYATQTGVGFLSDKGALEFLKATSPKTFLQKKTLYVLFPANLGIVAIENISDLKNYDLSVKEVVTGSAKVSYIGFFKKTGAGRKPVTESDRQNVQDIVCEVNIKNADLKQFHRHTVTVSFYYGNIKVSGDIVMDINFKPGEESNALQFFLFYRDRNYFHPGNYTVKIYIDNVKAGEKNFKITGKPDPFEAIRWKDNKTLYRMLKNGLNPNLKDPKDVLGRALLHDAIGFGSLQDVHLLLKYGADPNVIDKGGNTPIFYVYTKDADAFKKAQLLIQQGASVHVKNADGKTPLLAVIEDNLFFNAFNPDIIKLLLDAGAEVDVLNKDKETILMKLIGSFILKSPSKDLLEVIKLLLSKGANTNKKDKYGYAVLGRLLLLSYPDPSCLRILLKYRAEVNENIYDKAGNPRSLLYMTLLEYLDLAISDRPMAHKLRESIRLLIEHNARLLPGEEEIIFSGDIYKWIGLDFIASVLNRNESLFKKAKDIDDPEVRALVVYRLLAMTKNKVMQATSIDDFEAALKICNQAREISQKNYLRLSIIDVTLSSSSQTGQPLFGVEYWPNKGGGVYIVRVIPDTPASSAGLQAGDIIINFNGEELKSDKDHLRQIISRLKANNVYKMTVLCNEMRKFSEIFLYCGLLEYSLGKPEAKIDLSLYLDQKSDSPNAGKVRDLLKELNK
ncbi:MAG: ankyrin repeat domain-containing protein [Nitrospirota bacterium]